MPDNVKISSGIQPQYFNFGLPGQAVVNSTTTAIPSAPIPKVNVFDTVMAYVRGTAGAQSATVLVQTTNDPHTAGADDRERGLRNNFPIVTTTGSATITSPDASFRADMDQDEVYAVGVPIGTTMTYVSPSSATLSVVATATGTVQARFQANNWISLATMNLSGTLTAADGLSTSAAWAWMRIKVTAIAGTNAAVFGIQNG